MASRLSRILSRSKDKEADAAAETTTRDSPPPAYGASEPSPPQIDREDIIQPLDITSGFQNLDLTESRTTPTVDQCIAHLKVLECFYRLRQTVGSTDNLFNISDKVVYDNVPDDNKDKSPELLAKLAEKRWAVYVSRAVERFETWLITSIPRAKAPTVDHLEIKGEAGKLLDPLVPMNITRDNMPPVDVLMVWHAFMLNPRSYLEDCLRSGWMNLWHTSMPWQAAVDSINSETFTYEPGDEAQKTFSSMTGLPWNNIDDLSAKDIACPGCQRYVQVPLTSCYNHSPQSRATSWAALSDQIDKMLSSGHGYCDQDFKIVCDGCSRVINHDSLRAAKFVRDARLLISMKVPMRGTLLGVKGIPWKYRGQEDESCEFICDFPNEVMRGGVSADVTMESSKFANYGMQDVRSAIDKRLKSRAFIRLVRGTAGHRLGRGEKIGIRRMMSRYWDNSSPFALDLVGAVIRQGTFVEKMHNIDWLHSPTLPSTMSRLLTKYTRFVGIMRDKEHMAVPTLDVDLAWHTHQLSPYPYFHYTVEITKQFIDHDDKVAEMALNTAFAWTSKTYQKLYGEPYSECTCWYCEAVRESHTSVASRLFNTQSAQANEQLPHNTSEEGQQDPSKSVHISAHNAVRPTDDARYTTRSKLAASALESAYAKACSRAAKKGRRPPSRDDYYYSHAWGHPVYIPAYSPYVGAVAFTGMYYPVAPGCMALSQGAVGNCCSGTCGGGVAAGACAGAGAGSCAGGAAGGGCGGGGGGACGGGGGGGGCGGGGGGGGGGCGGGGGGGGGGGC